MLFTKPVESQLFLFKLVDQLIGCEDLLTGAKQSIFVCRSFCPATLNIEKTFGIARVAALIKFF